MFGMVSVLSILYSQFIEFLTEFVVDPFLHNVNRISHFVDFVITLKTSTCLYVCMGVTVDVVPSDICWCSVVLFGYQGDDYNGTDWQLRKCARWRAAQAGGRGTCLAIKEFREWIPRWFSHNFIPSLQVCVWMVHDFPMPHSLPCFPLSSPAPIGVIPPMTLWWRFRCSFLSRSWEPLLEQEEPKSKNFER